MPGVALLGLRKRFGTTPVLHDVSLDVPEGEFLAILGPSGCGKSTLLRILAGLETADAGEVHLNGRRVDHLPPKARDLAMVFQSYALYPYMTVAQNIGLPLEMRRLSAAQRIPVLGRLLPGHGATRAGIARDVRAAAEPLGLGPLLHRKPSQLSGGQRQRVALARAMVRQPVAFLMDEPLSNLDARLRGEARAEIVALQRRLGTTMLYVTHDQAEAMAMADRVAVMQGGHVLQVAPPQELYDNPASLAVARFVGSPPMNALPCTIRADGLVEVAGVPLPGQTTAAPGPATLGVRPEALRPANAGLPATVLRQEHLGAETLVHCMVQGLDVPVVVRLNPHLASTLPAGATTSLMPRAALLFGSAGERLPLVRAREAVHAQ